MDYDDLRDNQWECLLWLATDALRETAKQNLTAGVNRTNASNDDGPISEELENLLEHVDKLRQGAFRSLSEQPLVRRCFCL